MTRSKAAFYDKCRIVGTSFEGYKRGVSSSGRALRDDFLQDHRQLIKGLSEILKSLRGNDVPRAMALADGLDRAIGAHIELEEQEFYPLLKERLGSEFVTQLYEEHAAGKEAIATLLAHRGRENELKARADLTENLERMLEHALSCGSLLSHLDREDEERIAALHDRLRVLRAENKRWTECGKK